MIEKTKMKVVVIDDEQCIRDTFQWHLEDLGYEVVTSECPLDCPVYAGHDCDKDEACGDVLFIDNNLGGITGLEFLEQLAVRGCKGPKENKFLMSGNTKDIDPDRAARIGATILDKPISLSRLEEFMSALDSRKTAG